MNRTNIFDKAKRLVIIVCMMLMGITSSAQTYKLGDIDFDNDVSIIDVMMLVDIILNGYAPFSVEPASVSMAAGETATVSIFGGYGMYDAASNDTGVVEASLTGNVITLTGIEIGETTVIVKDVLTFRTIEIPVTVSYGSIQLSVTDLSLAAGSEGTVSILSGSGSYSVQSSDINVAYAYVEGSIVYITGVGGGTATVTVTDTESGLSQTIAVSVEYFPLTLSANSLTLYVGNQSTVNITSGNGSFIVRSSDTSIATATLSGFSVNVTAVAEGTATITVIDIRSGQTATISVTANLLPESMLDCPDANHPHVIDLGLPSGIKWACCNVGATKPSGYGSYYAWGETTTKSKYNDVTYKYSSGTDSDNDGFYDNNWSFTGLGKTISGTQYDVAHVKWGGSWKMPTDEQFEELRDNCTRIVVTIDGNKGRIFKSNINGRCIFIPANGYKIRTETQELGSSCHLWSGTRGGNDFQAFSFYAFYTVWTEWVYLGKSVRPVSE